MQFPFNSHTVNQSHVSLCTCARYVCVQHATISDLVHHWVTVRANNTPNNIQSLINLPSRVDGFLEIFNGLLFNLRILHSLKKYFPCVRLKTFPATTTPYVQPFLHCFFFIRASEAIFYCCCIKPHSFKDCPPLLCGFSANMLSE